MSIGTLCDEFELCDDSLSDGCVEAPEPICGKLRELDVVGQGLHLGLQLLKRDCAACSDLAPALEDLLNGLDAQFLFKGSCNGIANEFGL